MPPSMQPLAAVWDGLSLWCVDLAAHAAFVDAQTLAAPEQARAERFVFARDAARYRAARHALRCALGQALGCAAQDVRIADDAWGKPQCAPPHAVQFNLSHSGDWALIGLHPFDALGVDLELLHAGRGKADLAAATQLDATERAALAALPAARQAAALMQTWTRKEACLKALGWGLRVEPARVPAGLGLAPCVLDLAAVAPPEAAPGARAVVQVWSLAPTALPDPVAWVGAVARVG